MTKRRFLAVPAAMMIALGTVGVGFTGVAQANGLTPPTNVLATPASGTSVTVTWTGAEGDQGPPEVTVESYTVTASAPNKTSKSCPTPPIEEPWTCTITALEQGVTYAVTVTATFSNGATLSAVSPPVTPAAAPSPPTLSTIVAGSDQAYVSWSAPSANGSPISEYLVYASPAPEGGGPVCTVVPEPPATVPVTNCVTDGDALGNGTEYTVWVTAVNAAGESQRSGFGFVTPTAASGLPARPTNVVAANDGPIEDGRGAPVVVRWTAPTPVTGFPVSSYIVSIANAQGEPATFFCTVEPSEEGELPPTTCSGFGGVDMVAGTTYRFVVEAFNANSGEDGTVSAVSNGITPYEADDVPSAPGVTAIPGPAQVTLTWTVPSSPTAILGYEVRYALPNELLGDVACTTTTALSCVVSGLTPGESYLFEVRARNAVGYGASAFSDGVEPISSNTPSAPQTVAAVAGAGQATINWTAPASTGGSAITGYTVTGTPGGTCTTTGLTCTITGLTPGTSYTFSVRASNANGAGAVSAASNAVVPTGSAPGAPTGVTATAGNAQATVSWTAPANTGGVAITGYTVTSASTLLGAPVRTCTTTGALSCTVTGLTNGTPYTFTVTATNSAGTGAASAASAVVTPTGAVPTEPRNVSATAGNASAVVTWSAPTNPGSSAVTGYTVTSSPGGRTCTTTGALTCSVSGLTNGTPYFFTVTATNASGTSAASTASNIITPVGPSTANIVIEGSRDGRRINFEGESTGLAAGTIVRPWLRFPGQVGFQVGSAQRTIAADGTFSWGRNTGKRTAVQFRDATGLRSNTVIIEAR